MAVAVGVSNLYGLTMASSAEVNESVLSGRIEKAVVRDASGVTVHQRNKKLITETIQLRGKGDPNFAAVAAGSFAADTASPTSAEQVEYADGEYPDFSIEAMRFSDWSAPA